MNLQLVTGPLVAPVDVASARLHLRVDDTADDELIESLVLTAREHVEDITRRALLSQTWDYSIAEWPPRDSIKLPLGNLQTVTSIKWKGTAGTETTLTPTTDYLVETNGNQCGRIVLPYAKPWPSGTLYPSNPITIRFVCGWTTAVLVPSKIKSAVLMVCSRLYESRGEDAVGAIITEDKTVARLLESARLRDEF